VSAKTTKKPWLSRLFPVDLDAPTELRRQQKELRI